MTGDTSPRIQLSPSREPARRVDPRGFAEEPLFFGPHEAPLYGVLHLPGLVAAGTPADSIYPPIIHVHSFGIEQVAAYRMEVEFARAAAAAGFPVLRFHMRGCGDSFGDFASITFQSMVEDVVEAAAFLTSRGLGRSPVLLGVRLGAEIALRAAVALGGVRALVLWEPVGDPRGYFDSLLRSLLISALAHGKKTGETVSTLSERLRSEGAIDILGYPLYRTIYEDAQPYVIPDGAVLAQNVLLVSIGKRMRVPAAQSELADALLLRGIRCETHEIREEPGWQFNANPSFVCPMLTETTLGWCRDRIGAAEMATRRSPIGRIEVR